MELDSSVQSRIAPMDDTGRLIKPANRKVEEDVGTSPIDFRNLLINSNAEAAERAKKDAAGDLTSADSYKSFLENLNRQTEKQRAPKNKLDKEDFLKLFVTQLQNQDPLKPKDGTEMASELAQFNSVEQMVNVNTTLERMEGFNKQGQNLSLISSIGKRAYVNSGKAVVDSGHVSELTLDTNRPVTGGILEVKNVAGQTVMTKTIGNLQEGHNVLPWDGKDDKGVVLRDGTYTVSLTSAGENGSRDTLELITTTKIEGIDLKNADKVFKTDLGNLGVMDVLSIEDGGKKSEPKKPVPLKSEVPKPVTTAQADLPSLEGPAGDIQVAAAIPVTTSDPTISSAPPAVSAPEATPGPARGPVSTQTFVPATTPKLTL